jgi:hypothetical protein
MRMAPSRETPTPENLGIFKATYDGLRAADQQLQADNLEIHRLMSLKRLLLGPKSDQYKSLSDLLERHDRAAFGRQGPGHLGRNVPDKETRRFLESPELLDQALDRAIASKVKLESIRDTLWCSTNRFSRLFLRNLTLLDLPDEILLEIFEYVEAQSPLPNFHWIPSEDIKALRLVCRRVCSISSQLLVRVIHLDVHQESLERLEEISRHPTISKGVQAVKVVLHLYNSSFTDIEHFISYYAQGAESQIDMYEDVKMWEFGSPSISKEAASEMIARGREVAATLRRLLSGERSEEVDHYRVRVGEIHQRYRMLLQRQDSLIQSETFYRAVGSAIARMPCARALLFDDFHDRQYHGINPRALMVPGTDIWERLSSCMLQPLIGYEAKRAHLEPPDYQCVIPLVDAVRHAGAFLHHLIIKLSSPGQPMDLVPTPDLRPLFSSGMQQLRTFSFELSRDHDDNDDQDADEVHEFLSACLDTSNLQSLSLDMRGGPQEEHFPLRLRQIINRNQSLHKLNNISLRQFAFDHADLIAFVRRLPKPMYRLHMNSVRLLSGSWREALDALREKQPRIALFTEAYGAECDGMTEEEYNRVFKKEMFGRRTEAAAYISGRWPSNPIQALEDGRLDVGE